MGVIGGGKAESTLETLLSDGHSDVRYNAATGLARHGNARAVDVLLEMLDPAEAARIEATEAGPGRRNQKTALLSAGRDIAGAAMR